MSRNLAASFVQQRECYRGQDYLCYTIAYHLAPVLEMHRPAVLLSFLDKRRCLFTLWEENKHVFFPAGKLSFCELRKTENSACVLLYDSQLLDQFLSGVGYRPFLWKFGYRQKTLMGLLAYLQKRFQQESCPQEIGAFLGIPLEDIIGFMKNKGKSYKACGSWKVYGDIRQARLIFARCEEAKIRFLNFIRRGYPPGDYLRIHASRNIKQYSMSINKN